MIEVNKIYNEDCLETMSKMSNKFCDCFTDPVYNVGKDYGDYKDDLPDEVYINWIEIVLNELKRVAINLTIYVPKKWNLLYWNILGPEYQEIILPFNAAGAIRSGFSNQFNKLLTNAKPEKIIRNVWNNMPQPAMGYYFREETYGHPGYTSLAITDKVIQNLCGNLVYDPFMGTGTTAVSCIKAEKSFIGSEINKNYCQISEKRIKPFLNQYKLEYSK